MELKIQLLDSDIGFHLRPDSREGGSCLTSLSSTNSPAAPSGDLCTSLIQPRLSHMNPPEKQPRVPVSLSPAPRSPCPHHTPAGAHLPVWSYHSQRSPTAIAEAWKKAVKTHAVQ